MSTQLIRQTNPVARKPHQCIWCPEDIEIGQVYVHEVSTYYQDFQDHHWHPECFAAAQALFRRNREYEFEPHECKRGTSEPVN